MDGDAASMFEAQATAFGPSPIATAVLDTELKLRVWNPAIVELTGVPAPRALGHRPIEVLPRPVAERLEAIALRPIHDGRDDAREAFAWDDGPQGRRWLDMRRGVLRDAAGRHVGVLLHLTDATTERVLGQHVDALREALESAGLLVLRYDREGRVLDANATAQTALGSPRAELIGGSIFDIDVDSPRAAFSTTWSRLVETHGHYYQTRLRRRDGSLLPVEVFCAFSALGGEPTVFALARDRSAELEQQQALLHSFAETRAIVESAPLGIVFFKDMQPVRISQHMSTLLGYDQGELRLIDWTRLVESEAEVRSLAATAIGALDAGRAFTLEARLRRKDGQPLLCRVYGAPIGNTHWRSAGAVVCLQDITEQRAIEKALRNALRELSLVFDSAVLGLVHVANGRVVRANPHFERLFMQGAGAMQGAEVEALFDDAAEFARLRERFSREEGRRGPYQFDCRLRRADGSPFWAVVHGSWLDTGRDDGCATIAAIVDVTRERESELALRASEERFRLFAENIGSVFYIADAATGELLYVNERQYADIFGGTIDELRRMPFSAGGPVHHDDVARVRAHVSAADEIDGEGGIDFRILHPRKGERMGQLRLSRRQLADGRRMDFAIVDDVTEQRQTEAARMRALEEQRDLLVREVHHRIKNNLQGVAGLLQQTARSRPQIADVLTEVVGQIQAISQVHGLQMRAREALPLLAMAKAVINNVGSLYDMRLAVTESGSGLDEIVLPEQEAVPLALVLNELGTNAVKHRRPLAAVAASFEADGEQVVVTLRNEGRLPEGFDLARIGRATSGLGLLKSLLPRRGSQLQLIQDGEVVVTRLALSPPAIARRTGG
ncbi:PAS domain S-box protein [Derxia gummosa]|uniref:PAS domain S-box protein n=1 Tax=Derxia gummosa DSM 723 TaxID=1121388 RepID=A0A8B6X549_9BURK|nr:PAS domain S-box protein [Derxia gummosa]